MRQARLGYPPDVEIRPGAGHGHPGYVRGRGVSLEVHPRDWEKLAPEQRGLHRGLLLHRYSDPKTWREAVDAIENPDEKAVADKYLRGIVERHKAWVQARKS